MLLTGQILKKKQSCHLDAEPCSYNKSKCKPIHVVPVHRSLRYWPAFIVPACVVVSKKSNPAFRTKNPRDWKSQILFCSFHKYFLCIGVSSLVSSSSSGGRLFSATQHKIHLENTFLYCCFCGACHIVHIKDECRWGFSKLLHCVDNTTILLIFINFINFYSVQSKT